MKNGKRVTLAAVVVVVLLFGVLVWQIKKAMPSASQVEREKKISVVATFYPLEEFARAVGGDVVSVKSIVSIGVEPHDYEPTPRDIASIYQSDVFLLNGAGLDAWAEKIRPELEKRGVKVLQMSEVISFFSADVVTDPHFWLDPVWAQRELEGIRDVLTARDPARAEIYARNAEHYLAELDDLDMAYQVGLRQCALHTIVTSHNAFAYLAKRYGFEVIFASGLSKEAEVSPRALSEIVKKMRSLDLHYVFFETLANPRVAETLAQESGARTLIFNPIEGLTSAERQVGKNYLSIMRENLNNLQIAMECQK
jgi:zinc transport system substrate-binding protein